MSFIHSLLPFIIVNNSRIIHGYQCEVHIIEKIRVFSWHLHMS